MFASTALVVVLTASHNDYLTGFCEPLSPPYSMSDQFENCPSLTPSFRAST